MVSSLTRKVSLKGMVLMKFAAVSSPSASTRCLFLHLNGLGSTPWMNSGDTSAQWALPAKLGHIAMPMKFFAWGEQTSWHKQDFYPKQNFAQWKCEKWKQWFTKWMTTFLLQYRIMKGRGFWCSTSIITSVCRAVDPGLSFILFHRFNLTLKREIRGII